MARRVTVVIVKKMSNHHPRYLFPLLLLLLLLLLFPSLAPSKQMFYMCKFNIFLLESTRSTSTWSCSMGAKVAGGF
jgi:Na+-transporting methylmalonyl-CoA/oxaloacetate decarboxylase beta subunit